MSILRKAFRASPVYNFNAVERDRWVAAQAASVPAGSRVLDLAAGSAPYRPCFAHCRYETQDLGGLPPEELRGRQGYGDITYHCDATAIPVADATFDVVLCTEALEHFPEPLAVLREVARILKAQGRVILTAPLGSGLHQEPYHFYGGYTPHWYRRFLTENGFSQIHIEANGGFFKLYGQESIRFVRLLFPPRLHANLLTRILITPLWLALAPGLLVVMPVLCHLLDRLDRTRAFTVGYHVTAIKTPASAVS